MRSIATFCLLALLGAIAVFLLSNTAPVALTFLGMQSVTLPLAIWLAGALLAGGGTGVWFVILFRLAERRGARRERDRLRLASFGPDDFAMVDEGFGARDFAPAASSARDAGYGDRDGDYRNENYRNENYRDESYRDGSYRDENYRDGSDRDRNYRGRDDSDRDYRDALDPNDPAPDYREPVDRPRTQPVIPFRSPQDRTPDPFRRGGFVGRSPASVPEPEFDAIAVQPPVYDANYRVIQPPKADPEPYNPEPYNPELYNPEQELKQRPKTYLDRDPEPQDPENDWQSPGRYSSYGPDETDSSEPVPQQDPYRAAQAGDRSTDFKAQSASQNSSPKTRQQPFQPTTQSIPQPKDDWDIDEDLDW
ncbi:MAG: DUF1049 domain-containing protein [Synechococcales cyanobacterium CRU_2_2]|nr:DUF1049 domain-containing protein [Synechococcales cyanobacterium CRU_2_2]